MGKDTIFPAFSICCRNKLFTFDRPIVMGILNATPDSFYDGGRHTSTEELIQHARWLVSEGADIVDIGVVSTRPNALLLEPGVEAQRLAHVVEVVRGVLPDALISVDTCFSLPARKAIEAGADIVNDISGGLFDDKMFETVAQLQVPYILSHNRTTPDKMQSFTDYDDIIDDIVKFFSRRLDTLYSLGVKDVWIDPGFGFAKTTDQNFELLHRLDEITTLFKEPLLAGMSRKSMIYKTLGTTPDHSLNGTTALNAIAIERGARLLRVHDPRQAKEAITLTCKTLKSNTTHTPQK